MRPGFHEFTGKKWRLPACLLAALLSVACELDAGEMDADAWGGADRNRLARGIYSHGFENIRDPDTGIPLPESAAVNRENWPDFWEPVRAVGFPEYLIPSVRVVPDEAGQIPGAYRDTPNHVLQMDFDGTKVGVRTRVPVPVDPRLAYEYSLFVRDRDLRGARIHAGVDWMRIDPAASRVVRSDEIPALVPGQSDWAVTPLRLLVNDPPADSNAARFFVILDRDPESVGGAYHGAVWLDNITLKPLPKIVVEAPRAVPADDGRQIIPVRYTGLFDNVPDPDNPGFFRGKRYSRRVEVTDVFNQPVDIGMQARVGIEAGDDGMAVEEMTFPQGKLGVYYFNIRLYDADDRLATDVMRAVAVMKPEKPVDSLALRSGKPIFGVRAGSPPDAIIKVPSYLRRIVSRAGAKMTKIVPWRDSYSEAGANDDYYTLLADEIRALRAAGIGIAAVVSPPSAMFGDASLSQVIIESSDRLAPLLAEAGRRIGLFMDGWQWGDDPDGSMFGMPAVENLDTLHGTLAEFAGGLPITLGRRLQDGPGSGGAFPRAPAITEVFLPETNSAESLWPSTASIFPWLFEPYYRERGQIYPPGRLVRLAPPPATDQLERQARLRNMTGSWISLEPSPAYPNEPNAAAEKVQLEQLLVRAVYATILAPDVVFLGDLFNDRQGLLRRDIMGGNTLETMVRPAYLAAGVLAENLEGAEYLGQIMLLPPFEAHGFRRAGTDDSVIVLWHNSTTEQLVLDREEIANGPPLRLVDWAGNSVPLPAKIPVLRAPSFITGLSASLLLTRMSCRISPEPPVLAQNLRQNQMIEIVNHMQRQAPAMLRLRYAARLPRGDMENGWDVNPMEMRINMSPLNPQLTPGRLRYSASPDPNSPIQTATPERADKSGLKIAEIKMTVNTTPPADMKLYLPFNLQSEIDVEIEPLRRVNDPHFVTLQLKIRWFPEAANRRRGEIRLTPYFVKKGQMKETAAFPVAVKASPREERGRPDAVFESAEVRIPRNPQVQTWVGLTEDGGSNFYLVEVTDFLLAP